MQLWSELLGKRKKEDDGLKSEPVLGKNTTSYLKNNWKKQIRAENFVP
jgi:hypothetical protein